jgi:hypothetical protein
MQLIASLRSFFRRSSSQASTKPVTEIKSDSKALIRWYYFRQYYLRIYPALVVVFMIVALTAWNTVQGHVVLGSVLSFISCVSVLASYICITPWRKHPSRLLVNRAFVDLVLSTSILINAIADPIKCIHFSVLHQAMLLAGEGWVTCIAFDLIQSITNPFSSFQANLKRYHIGVGVFVGILSVSLHFDKSCMGSFGNGVCWIKLSVGSTMVSCVLAQARWYLQAQNASHICKHISIYLLP